MGIMMTSKGCSNIQMQHAAHVIMLLEQAIYIPRHAVDCVDQANQQSHVLACTECLAQKLMTLLVSEPRHLMRSCACAKWYIDSWVQT